MILFIMRSSGTGLANLCIKFKYLHAQVSLLKKIQRASMSDALVQM